MISNTSRRLHCAVILQLVVAVGALGLLVSQRASAQVATSWLPGNDLWSNGAKWTNGIPNSASADAYVDNQGGMNSIVTMGSGFGDVGYSITLGRLRIDSGNTVQLSEVSTNLMMDNIGFTGAG